MNTFFPPESNSNIGLGDADRHRAGPVLVKPASII